MLMRCGEMVWPCDEMVFDGIWWYLVVFGEDGTQQVCQGLV